MNNKVETIKPFTRFIITIGQLPTSYVMSMSYYEQVIWLCHYLKETIIPALNGNAEAIQELQDYLLNLNLQDEVNNKLDEMAESGELTEIIAQYLELAGILAFNTLNDLENADNLTDGSFTRIYGKLSYNDGHGSFYKIRQLINTDIIDGDNLVALINYPTLVAEKIPDANIENLYNITDSLNNKIDHLLDNNRNNNNLRYYIDGVNGSDDNDGLTSATAFKTIDKWLSLVNSRADLRCYIISAGTYSISKRIISSCVLHITSTLNNREDVIINSANGEDLVFYNTHLNFDKLTINHLEHIENSATTFTNCKCLSKFIIYGGSFKFATTSLNELTTEYCNGYLDNCTIDGQAKTQSAPLYFESSSVIRIRHITFEQPTTLTTNFIYAHSSSLFLAGNFNYTKLNDPSLDYTSIALTYCNIIMSNGLYNTLNSNYTLNNEAGLLVHATTTIPA